MCRTHRFHAANSLKKLEFLGRIMCSVRGGAGGGGAQVECGNNGNCRAHCRRTTMHTPWFLIEVFWGERGFLQTKHESVTILRVFPVHIHINSQQGGEAGLL